MTTANTTAAKPRTNKHIIGMLFFIGSEIFFFLTLLSSYAYLSGAFGNLPRSSLAVPRTLIFSLFLWASSLTIWIAERNFHRRRFGAYRGWMVITILLGLTFLTGQGIEYTELFRKGIALNYDVFSSAFFTLTGFHGLHVVTGLIMLSSLTGMSFAGKLGPENESAVVSLSYYWHFVDAVWIAVFCVAYLIFI
ncbi:MAG: heme-copper oxidase subunit III [Deinococcales bacterium]|jgi:heme/copper-type cytochrome/quinol oxidase subunit 3